MSDKLDETKAEEQEGAVVDALAVEPDEIDEAAAAQKAAYLDAADKCIEARTANMKKRTPKRTAIVGLSLVIGFGLSFMGLNDLVQSPNPIFTGALMALVIMAFGIWFMDTRVTTIPENAAKTIVESSLIDDLEVAAQKRTQSFMNEPDDSRAAFVARDMALLYLKALGRHQGPIVDCSEEGSPFSYGYVVDAEGNVESEFIRDDAGVRFRKPGEAGEGDWKGVRLKHRTQIPTPSWLNEQAKLWLHVAQGQFEALPTQKQLLRCMLLFEDCDLYLMGCGDLPAGKSRTSASKTRLDDLWLDATRTGDKQITAEIEIVRDSLEGFMKTKKVKTMLGGLMYNLSEGVMDLVQEDSPEAWQACHEVWTARS